MKNIKIGIDGGDYNPEYRVQSGIQRLVSSFLRSIYLKRLSTFTFYYYYFSQITTNLKNESIHYINLPRKCFSSIFIPVKCIFNRITIYMGFSGIITPIVRLFKKTVVFIHDFGFYDYPEYYHDANKLIWQTNYSIFGANTIIVFSQTVRNQLLHKFPSINASKIVVIYPGVDYLINNKATSQRILNDPYFLYVGVIKKIKNIKKLITLFSTFITETKMSHVKLVLIGVKEKSYWKYIKKNQIYSKIKNNLILIEHVSDSELVTYYKQSMALLNVSLVEGFCYPVVEALALGKKVITNNLPLYSEYKPYFEGLSIAKSDTDFLIAMKKESRKKNSIYKVKQNPFKWSMFTSKLLTVVNNISK